METKNIYQKILEAQTEIKSIKKENENPYYNSHYFDINAILAEIKPVLNKHGLVLLQRLNAENGRITLNTSIINCDTPTESIEASCYLPEIADPQKIGSAISYFRRYSLQSLLALEAEDDDGNYASNKKNKDKESDLPF